MYSDISNAWKTLLKEKPRTLKDRAILWRKESTLKRLERPSRLDRARTLGYKAKQGFVVIRVRVGRGGMRKKRPKMGRRPRHFGVVRIKGATSMKLVSQKRVSDKYPNLTVLNSYMLYQDGRYSWYEVIAFDPYHPSIKRDKELSSIVSKN